jgi:hypothetical protein
MAEQTQILPHRLHTTFISLRNSNFRIYFAAQIGSNIGNWIQITAENHFRRFIQRCSHEHLTAQSPS